MDPLEFFSSGGPMTKVGHRGDLISALPQDIRGLVKSIQGLLIHIFWLDRYGVKIPDARKAEVQIRSAEGKLERILRLDRRALGETRALEDRLISNCRDFSLMLATVLRHRGVPARARCGFATYFQLDHFEDHWVCEYWNAESARWQMIDGQLDELHLQRLDIDFDPLDVPRDRFIVAGEAWKMCGDGQEDPEKFGIFDLHGMGFIRGNLVRDIASLNKLELLPWDCWGVMEAQDAELTSADHEALDLMAALTTADVPNVQQVWEHYENDVRFHVPPTIRSYTRGGAILVELPESETGFKTAVQAHRPT